LPQIVFSWGHFGLIRLADKPSNSKNNGVLPQDFPAADDVFVFPASFAQQRLWFLDKLEPEESAYNVPFAVRLSGPLDKEILERSFRELIRRHEVLCTTFAEDDQGEPVQLVAADPEFQLPVADLRRLPHQAREHEVQQLLADQARQPFNLAKGPLVRANLLQLGEEEHILSLVLHHTIVDGWSWGILLREISTLYRAFRENKPSPLPDLPIQYGDFAVWQRDWMKGERLAKLLDYWKQQLQGAPPVLELPTDFARPAVQTYEGELRELILPKPLADRLQELAAGERCTLFMVLLAAFSILLSRYSRQEDIVVGTPVAGRDRSELEGLIGLFVNTLALRTDLSGNPSFRELLRRVREVTLGAYAHQDLPFEKLVEEIRPERRLSHAPVFQVMLGFQNVPNSAMELPGLKLSSLDIRSGSAKVDLTLNALIRPDGLRLGMIYNVDLFQGSTIEGMLAHLQTLLESIAARPEQPISALSMLDTAERRQLLADWNDTRQDYPRDRCIHELVESQAEQTPEAVAVVFEDQHLTYGELNRRANQLARHLRQLGVGPDVLVGLCMERSLDLVVGLLGILKAGGAYVPVDPSYPRDRIAFMLGDAAVKILLTEHNLLGNLPDSEATRVCVDSDWATIAHEDPGNLSRVSSPENLAYVIYTSGSTGKPKGVQIPHRAVVNFLYSMREKPGLTRADSLLAVTTLSFDIAGLEIYLPLLCGARVLLASRELASDGARLLKCLEESGTTVMQATPATWRMLLEVGWTGSPRLKILCGGEALTADLAQALLPRCAELWNMYGPTETTIWSAAHQLHSAEVVLGRPIGNTQFYVLDDRRQLLPVGVPGELYIGGDGLARGYLNRPELTAEKFVANRFSPELSERLYRTGDLVRWLPGGIIDYLGRIDYQVKIRGFRIELGEIENVLASHPAVRQAVVVVREDNPGDKRLVAYFLAEGDPPASEELRTHLKQSLPDYMVPGAFVVLQAFPLTPNGKVDRRALPAPDYAAHASTENVAPRNENEQRLLEIWQRVLNVSSISVKDNFFDLGGHSLLAVRLLTEIKKATGKEIPLAAFFQGATIEYLATLLSDGLGTIPTGMVVEIQGKGSRPPFFGIVTPGANALGYVQLSRYLGEDQPFYKIQGRGQRHRERPYTPQEFEHMADDYIRAMRRVQPRGPYYLGGMCEGARIAFDMARHLEAAGEKVQLLAIFDTWVIENSQRRLLWYVNYYRLRLRTLASQPVSECIRMVWDSGLNTLKRLLHVGKPRRSPWPAVYWPGKNFVPTQCSAPITVFKAPKQPFYYVRDPMLGWGSRTTGGVEVRETPGRHNFMLREPYVQAVAKELGLKLKEVCPPSYAERAQSSLAPAASSTESRYLTRAKKLFERRPDDSSRTGATYPMSVQQRRLWVLDQLEAGATHNVLLLLQLKGRLDREALQATLDVILARHEALRTRFRVENGQPIQVVVPPEGMPTRFVDLTNLSAFDQEESTRQLALEELHRSVDLSNGPLVRALLVQLGRTEHALALVAHQIVCDTRSADILSREIAEIYSALVRDDEPDLAEPAAQYPDFALQQNQDLQQGAFKDDLEYWKQRLAGVSGTELPTDRARPPMQRFRGALESFTIPLRTLNTLRALSQQEGVSLFVVLSAVFASLLSRYTGSEDTVIGTEVSGRTSAATDTLVGRLATFLVLRTDLSNNPSFRELVRRVGQSWNEAQQHRSLPFGSLVEELRLPRDLSRNPLFQLLFAMREGAETLVTPTLKFEPRHIESGSEVMDLAVTISEYREKLDVRFTYNTDLFLPATIQRLMGHFRSLLEAAAASPDERLSELVLLTDAERHKILVEWNATAVDYPRDIPLHEFIEKQVERTPDATALIFQSEKLTYGELNSRANQLARRLRQLGVGPDVLVGVCAERSVEIVIALLSVLKAGGAYVPLDPDYPRERLESMISDAKPQVLLTQAHLWEQLPATTAQIICLDRDWQSVAQEGTDNLPRVGDGKHLAYVIYTSGSTGKPKGVGNVHEAIVNRLLWMQDMYRLTAADRVLQKTPYSFDVSVWEFFWPLMTGACLVVARPGGHKDPVYLVDLIVERQITTLHFVPSMLSIFLEADGVERCDSIRRVFASGEALPYELEKRFFERLKAELHNLYGPTEAAVDVTYWHCQPDLDQPIVPIGRPVANTQIYILDRNLKPVPVGVAGELHIGGIQLARGYLNRPDLTAEKFIPNPFSQGPHGARLYKTGDLARFLPDGNIEYLGRIDHQVKLRGFRIELGEIETVLAEDTDIRQAVVSARQDTPGNKQLVAYIVLAAGRTFDAARTRERLKDKLPEYMVPAKFVVLEHLPMTTSGKVDRKALPAPREESKGPSAIIPPRSDAETLVVSIFRTLLGRDSISVTDDFFDLGGHSLTAASLVAELHRQTGRQIPLSVLFRGATPEYLAAILEDIVEPANEGVAMLIQPGDSGPVFFAVVPPGENAVGYAKLARYMGNSQRVYKLQGPGEVLVDRPYTHEEMQRLAEEYVNAMCAVQPEGPYHFGGLCDGAHIALRMAQRLEELGEQVGILAIFDTWVLENSQRLLPWYIHYYSQRLRDFRNRPLRKKIEIGLRGFRNVMRKALRLNQRRSLWSEAYWPDKQFVPPQFCGRVTLFKRPEQPYFYVRDPEMGWGARAKGGVDVQVLPIHHAEMLHEPHVRILAHRLRDCLQRYQASPAPAATQDNAAELAVSGNEARSEAS
jgi:amino acid adenylation domain-containing protein